MFVAVVAVVGGSGVASSVSRWVAKAWACGLEIWTADLETFNDRSGDLLDGCGWLVFVPPVVLGGGVWLPDGSGWLAGWLVVVFWVGRGGNGWPAMLGLDLRGGSRWGGELRGGSRWPGEGFVEEGCSGV
uniref:Uncharacterized protein n=1 Tax=Fagus sylvatica TaxID=28930 RepID=A0A2N9I2I0_FAGSY